MEKELITYRSTSHIKETFNEPKIIEFCELLSESLDKLGYSTEMIHFRRYTNKKMDEIFNSKPFTVFNITTGGKAEGTALYFESDIDRLYVMKEVACVEPGFSSSKPTVFHLDMSNCSPGYTRLKLVHLSYKNDAISKYLTSEHGAKYIMNDIPIPFSDSALDINGDRITKIDRSGPSESYGNTFIKYDFVLGVECSCPQLIQDWIQRPRNYDWPDTTLVQNIATLEGHAVPVANKRSKFPQTEWRICFTKAESMLMYSLDEFQTKLYILLKLIAKSVLKPLCREMSSYVMKNILFWIIETNPKQKFSKPFLVYRLIDCLVYLKDCLRSNVLNNYMIVQRNLFEGRITEYERETLSKKIDELIGEKETMLQRNDKIWLAMSKLKESPHEFVKEAEKRDRIEKLVYKKNIIFKEIETKSSVKRIEDEELQDRIKRNDVYMQYEKELHELVIPDKEQIIKLGQNFEHVYKIRLSSILS